MSNTAEMTRAYPGAVDLDAAALAAAIDAALTCFQTCAACADACLAEEMVSELTRCMRTDLDCADVCLTTIQVLSRRTGHDPALTRAQLEACVIACRSRAQECEQHASMHDHCRLCAEACHACEQACQALLTSLA